MARVDSAKPDRAGQPGVEQQQDQHRDAQRPHAGSRAACAQAEQRHRSHGGGPQHARLGPGEQHEPGHPEHAHHQQAAGPHPRPARRRRAGSRPPASGWCPTPRRGGSARRSGSPRRRRRTSPGRHRRPGPAPVPAASGAAPATDARIPARTRAAPANSSPGRRSTSASAARRAPRRGPDRPARPSRPVARTVEPERARAPGRVADDQHRRPGRVPPTAGRRPPSP